MTDTNNQILDAAALLIGHPAWDQNTNVSAEVYEAQLQQCPYVGKYDAYETFHEGTLFSDCVHTNDNRIGALWCFVRKNGMIRQVSTGRFIRYPLKAIYPFQEILVLLENRFGSPVSYARQDIFFDHHALSNVYIYSTPKGEARISLHSDTSEPSNPTVKVEVLLSPGLDVQEPTW